MIKAIFLCYLVLFAHSAAAIELDKVTLQLKWKHQFQFAGYYAAKSKGLYQQAGLDVTLLEAVSGTDPIQ